MKKHLVVLVALVALPGLVHGLGGGTAGGGASGAKEGTAGGITRKSSAGGGSSGLSVSENPSGTRNSSLGGVAGGATVGASEGAPQGPSVGSSRVPGVRSSPSGTSTGGSGAGEGPSRFLDSGSSNGNFNDNVVGRLGGSSGPQLGSTPQGSSLVGVGGGGSRANGDRRLGGNIFSSGPGFPGDFDASGDYNEGDENGLFPSGSSRRNSGFGRGGRFRDVVASTTGFGSFGSPIAGRSIGGLGGTPGANAGGRRGLDEDELSEEPSFRSTFGTNSGFHRSPTSHFNGLASESSGLREDFGFGNFERNWNGGAGVFGESTPGYGSFSISNNGGFSSTRPGFEIPAGLGRSSDEDVEGLPGSFTERGPGAFAAPDTEPEGSAGWPTSHNFKDFEGSGLVSSGVLNRHVTNKPVRSGLLHRLQQSRREGLGPFEHSHRLRKPDARLAAAIAAGTLVGAAAISSIGAGIAAAIRAGRTRGIAGLGGHRRICLGRCRAQQQRLNEGIKTAEVMFNSIPRGIERLY